MDRIFIRNFVLLAAFLLVFAGTLVYGLITGEAEIKKTDLLILQSQEIISQSEHLSALVEGMLSAQRGYIMTPSNEDLLKNYNDKKAIVSELIASLAELIGDNKSQESRLSEVRTYFTEFTTKLEERSKQNAENAAATKPEAADISENVALIDGIRNNIIRVNDALLQKEHETLTVLREKLDDEKERYFESLLTGIILGAILLLTFNAFLLNSQRKRSKIEASLKDTEQRYALAVEGTQDGIFDWDVRNDRVFYSRRFFGMLGYERAGYTGSSQDFRELLHPDDGDQAWSYIQQYLNGELSEYTQEFRMKHQNGRWVWIQSRAKALFDSNGMAYRMVGAHTDITPSVKMQERLEAEKKEAEEANRAKSDFLAHMSHEIRTPLTAIKGIAEIFEKNQSGFDDRQKKLVSTLVASTSSLKDLINDILDFSKIESGELELSEESFYPEELFEEIISMMGLKANEKGISFVFDFNDIKGTTFYGDKVRMRQILVNLIGNGIKFTDQGGVTIRAYREMRNEIEFLRIDVVDTGIGIDADNFDLIFERFKQADSSVSRKYGGTGLGLPISRNLSRLMGGDIFLSSETGKGSTFSLLLPIKNTLAENRNTVSLYANKKLTEQVRAALNKENRILVAEDYEGNVVVISYILDEIGLPYDIARTGSEALSLWHDSHYSMILMDIQMPEMDGFAATREIRRYEQQKSLLRTPIIGMTAHALVGDKDKCIEAGMDAYLPKPIVESDLKKEILHFLNVQNKAA